MIHALPKMIFWNRFWFVVRPLISYQSYE